MPAVLDAVTLQLTMRGLGLLPRVSLGLAIFSAVRFTHHLYVKWSALCHCPRLQVRLLSDRVRLGRVVLRGSAVGLAVRQSVPPWSR